LEVGWYNPFVLQTTRLSHPAWNSTHMDALQQTSDKYNMRINVKKAKVMRMPERKGRKLRIMVSGRE